MKLLRNSAAGKASDVAVGYLMRAGIDGGGDLASASKAAERALAATDDPEQAIDRIVATHTRLAAAGGFVTGLGGFLTLPVALSANVLGFYVVATRMVAAIAAVRGHDISHDAVRTTVLLTLTGNDSSTVLSRAGIGVNGIAAAALQGVSPAALMMVNKAVAFRLFAQVGQKSLARLGRGVPVVGGVVGGAFDAMLMHRIASHARMHFPQAPRELGADQAAERG
ncbi:EcsC family protein [Actinopolymorpha singaporensis]|uniref:EcsC protein family protein n=1 Tax=Actinopolymorpha singaporensis TaxID=117157 RepID=A0A1H1WFT5_9ACTN|nr:EcsC family protein [Actinopolymorpha singaporensis]SDS95491.1 EcsC protein family protein [Actinopolymorpha singaporensis]